MPWTKDYYLVSMKNLPDKIRNKAIEIANALLEEKNMQEGMAIAIAISRAKAWVKKYNLPSELQWSWKEKDVM